MLQRGFPSAFLIQGYGLPVGELDDHLRRPSVLGVFAVHPVLLHRQGDFFGLMDVCQLGNITFHHRLLKDIAARRRFLPGINDLLAVAVLGQVFHGGDPVVVFVQGDFLDFFPGLPADFRALIPERHFQFRRADAVLILPVIPDLHDGSDGRIGKVLVGDDGDRAFSHLALQLINIFNFRRDRFGPGIGNFLPVLILGQVGFGMLPLVRFQLHILELF